MLRDRDDYTVVLEFGETRATDGTDIGGILRANFGGDIRVVLDDAGAVCRYVVTLHYEDPDMAVEASFRLAEFMREIGLEYVVANDG